MAISKLFILTFEQIENVSMYKRISFMLFGDNLAVFWYSNYVR